MRAGNPGVPTTSEWLNDVLTPGARVGIDPVSISNYAMHLLMMFLYSPFLFSPCLIRCFLPYC